MAMAWWAEQTPPSNYHELRHLSVTQPVELVRSTTVTGIGSHGSLGLTGRYSRETCTILGHEKVPHSVAQLPDGSSTLL